LPELPEVEALELLVAERPTGTVVERAELGSLAALATYASGCARPGRGPLAPGVGLSSGAGFELTKQGTEKTLAPWLVAAPVEVEGVAKLPSAKVAGKPSDVELERLDGVSKGVLRSAAGLSTGTAAGELKDSKRAAIAVHWRSRLPSPERACAIGDVFAASRSFQCCPQCETGGRVPADRRLSRLLK